MEEEKKLEVIEEMRKLVQDMVRTAFEVAREGGHELTPRFVLVTRKDPAEEPEMLKRLRVLLPVELFDKDGNILMLINVSEPFGDDRGKDICSMVIRGLVKKLDVFYVALISESWVSEMKKEKWDGKPASKQANRKEVVTIMESTPFEDVHYSADIVRKKGKDNRFRELGEWKEFFSSRDGVKMAGRFAGFFDSADSTAKA